MVDQVLARQMRMIRERVMVQVVMALDLLDLVVVDVDIRLDVVVQLLRAGGEVVQLDGGLDVYEQIVWRLRYRRREPGEEEREEEEKEEVRQQKIRWGAVQNAIEGSSRFRRTNKINTPVRMK